MRPYCIACVQESPGKRPDISRVLEMLRTDCELPEPEDPTLPAVVEEGETSGTRRTDDDNDIREQNHQL